MTNVISTNESSAAVVRVVKSAINAEFKAAEKAAVAYAEYVTDHVVTLDTVGKHVKHLTNLAHPGVKYSATAAPGSKERNAHTFNIRVRKGLNTALGKVAAPGKPSDALLTPLGKSATLEDVIAEWEAAQS